MQYIIKTIAGLSLLLLPFISAAHSTYLPQGSKHQPLLDRLEIMLQRNNDLNLSTVKPLSRRVAARIGMHALDTLGTTDRLSVVDAYNIQSLLMNNSEWVTTDKSSFASKKPIWNTFYKTKANFIEVDTKDFFLAVNPVIQQQQSVENDNDQRIFVNAAGIEADTET